MRKEEKAPGPGRDKPKGGAKAKETPREAPWEARPKEAKEAKPKAEAPAASSSSAPSVPKKPVKLAATLEEVSTERLLAEVAKRTGVAPPHPTAPVAPPSASRPARAPSPELVELEAAGPQTVLAKVGGVWASYAGDAEADDLPLEVAFRAAMARSRKGGMSSLQPAERRIVESCKVLMWGYVAEPRFLSTRALKNNAEVDVMAAEEMAKGTDGALAGVANLGDGLVTDGYRFLIDHLAKGVDVRLGCAVTKIVHSSSGAAVHLEGGEVIDADFVVVTLPLGVLKVGDGAGLVHDGTDGGDGGAIEEIDADGFGDEAAAAKAAFGEGAWFSPKPPPQVAGQSPADPALVRAARAAEGETLREYEGLRLHLSTSNSTGYRGVTRTSANWYFARYAETAIGYFETALEAAVAYAKSWKARVAAEAAEAEAAVAAAAAEGLVTEAGGIKLRLSSQNTTGYLGITIAHNNMYQARYGTTDIGSYDDVVEAAVAYNKYVNALPTGHKKPGYDGGYRDDASLSFGKDGPDPFTPDRDGAGEAAEEAAAADGAAAAEPEVAAAVEGPLQTVAADAQNGDAPATPASASAAAAPAAESPPAEAEARAAAGGGGGRGRRERGGRRRRRRRRRERQRLAAAARRRRRDVRAAALSIEARRDLRARDGHREQGGDAVGGGGRLLAEE